MQLKSVSILAAVAAIGVTACAPLNDPNNPYQNTQRGALVGAGVGAVTGALTARDGEEKQEAIKGAIIGGALGAGGGYWLDRQEAELRNSMGSNVGITNTGDQLIVSLPESVLFAVDSTVVSPSAQGNLQALARSLNNYPNSTVNIVGHTDNTGSAAYNQDLSDRRARAVASVLLRSGVTPNRINAYGVGENQPIADNLTDAGRAQNRRVEITITPTG